MQLYNDKSLDEVTGQLSAWEADAPVSYTHLDVYKRQGVRQPKAHRLGDDQRHRRQRHHQEDEKDSRNLIDCIVSHRVCRR